ncbi:glutaminase A [Agromyces sp. MMS24-JH15]|uniref:glutaminase A n=1 Tax=Agromyces sp. MMS24-JH15 TaxID=3243765 RepID=UPI00374A8D11
MPVDLRDPVRLLLDTVLADARVHEEGAVADYIPELANADPDALGIALVSTRGVPHEAGDSGVEFTIQSVSKPFAYALALDLFGIDAVSEHVGLEPSGEPFNAISLDEASGRPMNPMINAGAIVTTSLLPGATADEKFAVVRTGLERFAGRELGVDEAVFASEAATGDRNRALAYLTRSAGTLGSTAEVATTAYFRQCSVLVTARDLAIMAATLATGGVNPVTGERVISEDAARWTMAVMTGCGMYDASGTWLVRVGLPAKSGVGGGIVAVQPGQFGIGTFSPRLDARGNSVRGVAMLEALSRDHGLHMLAHREEPLSPIGALSRSDDGMETVAALRGELRFAAAEEVLTRLAPLVRDDGTLVLDFSSVTSVGPAATRLFRALPGLLGPVEDRHIQVVLHDPEGVLDDD